MPSTFANVDDRTVLLLFPSRKEMYPLNTAALTRAQTSRRKLANDYRDALVLDQDGSLRMIERIDVLGPWGSSTVRRLLSRFTDAWSIDVELSGPLPCSLQQIRRILIDCMGSLQSAESMRFEVPRVRKQFLMAVLAAPNAAELMVRLKLPEPDHALDVL
jgi:hypothetical protein